MNLAIYAERIIIIKCETKDVVYGLPRFAVESIPFIFGVKLSG